MTPSVRLSLSPSASLSPPLRGKCEVGTDSERLLMGWEGVDVSRGGGVEGGIVKGLGGSLGRGEEVRGSRGAGNVRYCRG